MLSATKFPLFGFNEQELPVENILVHPYKNSTVIVWSSEILYEINATSCLIIGAHLDSITQYEGLCHPAHGFNATMSPTPQYFYSDLWDIDVLRYLDGYYILLTLHNDNCVVSKDMSPNSSYAVDNYIGKCMVSGSEAGYRYQTRIAKPFNTIVSSSSQWTRTYFRDPAVVFGVIEMTCQTTTGFCISKVYNQSIMERAYFSVCYSNDFDMVALNSRSANLILQLGNQTVTVPQVVQRACTFMGNNLFITQPSGSLLVASISPGNALNGNVTFRNVKIVEDSQYLTMSYDDHKFLYSYDDASIFIYTFSTNSLYTISESVCHRPERNNGQFHMALRLRFGNCGAEPFMQLHSIEIVFCGYVCAKINYCNSFSYDEVRKVCSFHHCYRQTATDSNTGPTQCYIMT